MAKFNWGRALTSAGNSLQDYFMQQDAERRRQEDIARRQQEIQAQRDWASQQRADLWARQDAQAEAARREKYALDPMSAVPQGVADYYGMQPTPLPAVFGASPFGVNAAGPSTGPMRQESHLANLMAKMPKPGVPAPTEAGMAMMDLGDGWVVPVTTLSDGTKEYGTPKQGRADEPAPVPLADFAQIPEMPGYSGQRNTETNQWTNIKKDVKDDAPALDPSWIDAYGNPRYSNFGPGQELAFLLRDASTDFTNPSGRIDWERETVEPIHVNDIDEYKDGVFRDTGFFGQGELSLDEVTAKVAEAIAGAADKGMVYAGIVKDLESKDVPQEVLNKVMPEFDGWDLDELRELVNTPPPPPREALEAAPGARRRWAKGENGFEWQFYIGDTWTRWE